MIHPFQRKISHNWKKHPDGLDDVRQALGTAGGGDGGAKEVVQAEDMHDVEIGQAGAAIAFYRGVPTDGVIAQPGWKVDGLHAAFGEAPAEGGAFGAEIGSEGMQAGFEAPVGREHRNLMTALREALGESVDLYGRAGQFEKRGVGFGDVQDPHCSRRIFFKDLAKTLKRNSLVTRSRPRSPMLRARAGSRRSVSMQVASWTASPCCTR